MGKTKRYRVDDDSERKVKNHYRRNKKKFHINDVSQLDEIEDDEEFEEEFFESFSKIKKRGTQ